MLDPKEVARFITEDPDVVSEESYMPVVMADGEVWEGYFDDNEVFHPSHRVTGNVDKSQLMHVDKDGRPIRREV